MTRTGYGFWKDGAGGAATMQFKSVWSSPTSGGQRTNTCIMEQDFYPSYYPTLLPGPTAVPCSDTYPLPVALAWQHAEVITRQDYSVTNRDGDYYFEHLVDKFSAQAKIKLYTGGKAGINRQNLWAISGSATEHRQIGVTSGINVPIWTNLPVPPGQITMGELGALGSDGIRWTTLPDDTTKDITPFVKGLKWYDFDAGAQKYKLSITANGYPLARDRVRPLAKYCVGQYLKFAPAWSPPLPDGTVANPVQWSFDGNFVNKRWQHRCGESPFDGPCGSVNYTNDPTLLNNETTSAWWTSGVANSGANYTAHLGEGLTFSNGQSVAVATHGLFSMYRPTFSNFLPIFNFFTWNSPWLQGNMSWRLTVNSKYDGALAITQLLNGSGFYYHTDGWVLDGNSAIYGDGHNGQPNAYFTNNPAGHDITLDDNPHAPTTPCCDVTANFKDYVVFMPTGNNSIYVTLAIVGWSVDGSACLTSGMTRSNIPPATAPVGSEQFPEWIDNRSE